MFPKIAYHTDGGGRRNRHDRTLGCQGSWMGFRNITSVDGGSIISIVLVIVLLCRSLYRRSAKADKPARIDMQIAMSLSSSWSAFDRRPPVAALIDSALARRDYRRR